MNKPMNQIIEILDKMKTSRVKNYVIAGLDSYLLENGKIRYFQNSRNHNDFVTPHSHRFDFTCLVLEGNVSNHEWVECTEDEGDLFGLTELKYKGEIGHHERSLDCTLYYRLKSNIYFEGDCYSMKSEDIHSIDFSKNAKVLFFEGPEITNTSVILEPWVNGKLIKTYEIKDYMFLKD